MKRSRTSKTIIGLLVVLIVLLIRGTRRQRRLFRLLTGFTFRYPGEDAVGAIGGWFGSIGSNIKSYVEAVIREVASRLQSGIDWVLSVARAAAEYARNLFDYAISVSTDLFWRGVDYAHQVLQQAIDTAQWIGGAIRDFAVDLFHQVSGYATSLYWQAIDFINRVSGAARDFAVDLWNNVRGFATDLFHQANALIGSAVDWALGVARGLISEANRQIHDLFFSALDFTRDQVGAQISTVNDYLFGSVQTIIDAVTDIIDWVIAIASFPFTTARDMWEAMRQSGGASVLSRSPDFVDRWADHVMGHARTYVTTDRQDYQLPRLGDVIGGNPGSGGGGGNAGSGTPDLHAFAVALLDALGAPASDSNLRFLSAWFAHEGTRATFNPLATTLDYGNNTIFNPVGVRNYADFMTGVGATVLTLTGSDYPTIVAALRAGDGHAAGQAHRDLSRWSGGGYDTINV